jgi:hypothetical protein
MSIKVCGNVVIPNQSGNANNNLALGATSGLGAITTGTDNIAIGNGAGQCVTGGVGNNFFGRCAGQYNTTGAYNNFIGTLAGCSNTTGNNNNFIGAQTGAYNTDGVHNNFMGPQSGYFNTSGAYNNFIGGCAGFYNTTGSSNTFIGRNAGRRATTGSNNNVLGRYFMLCMATCNFHSFIGGSSGCNSGITINNCNALAFGGGCGTFDYGTAGYVLTSCGSSAAPVWAAAGGGGVFSICGTNNIVSCIGGNGGTGTNNIFIGKDSGTTNVSGNDNNFIGRYAGCCNAVGIYSVSGSCNNFIGFGAGLCNYGGQHNTFIGTCAGAHNGSASAYTPQGSYNTFIGFCAGYCNSTGTNNNVLGSYSMVNMTTCNFHTFLGGAWGTSGITINNCNALAFGGTGGTFDYGSPGYVLTSCGNGAAPVWAAAGGGGGGGVFATNGNNVLPYQLSIISCLSNPAGSYAKSSFIVGKYAAPTSSGSDNIIMGSYAGYPITTGSNNILIGQNSGWQGAYGPIPGGLAEITTQSDRIILGNSGHTCAQIQIGWTTVSDCRDKHIFGQVPHGRGFLQNLETIEYAFKDRETGCITDPAGKRRYGFSAQNVLAAEGDSPVIVSNDNPDKLQLTSDYMVPVLVNAVNELSRELEILKERLALLEAK